jgi:hypothetical protein
MRAQQSRNDATGVTAVPIELIATYVCEGGKMIRTQTALQNKLSMCNLYSITTNQAAIAALVRVVNRMSAPSHRCRVCSLRPH